MIFLKYTLFFTFMKKLASEQSYYLIDKDKQDG